MYVIDGYNLIFAMPNIRAFMDEGKLIQARRALLARLGAFHQKTKARIVVFLDAKNPPFGVPHREMTHGIEVRLGVYPQTADSAIADYVAEHHDPKSLTVISSDREVIQAARRYKAAFETAHTFAGKLDHTEEICDDAFKLKQADVPESEVNMWLEYFGIRKQDDCDT